MTMQIYSLYPQYKLSEDRRKHNIPVEVDRRSGKDRRSADRVSLDSRLTQDIYQVKEQISKLENLSPKLFSQNIMAYTPSFAEKNHFTQDQFVKEAKPDITEVQRQEAKLKDKEDTGFKLGVITAAIASIAAISFLGTAGVVIAVGSALYIGSKILKNTIVNEIQDEKHETNEYSNV